jgi:hypothetical protein
MDQNGKVQFIKSIISLECLLTSPAAAREPLSHPAPNQPPDCKQTGKPSFRTWRKNPRQNAARSSAPVFALQP